MKPPADEADSRRDPSVDRAFKLVVTSVFFTLCLFNVWHHVMWRDEMRVWQICAASPTWTLLRENMQFDGVPVVWFAIVWMLTKCTSSPFAMQLTHACIATAVVWVFVRYAPFNRVIKILFPFGYFPFFEYATISRNYSLVFLCVLVATHLISFPTARPIRLALLLGFLAQVSVWGAAFAVLFLIVAAIRWTTSKDVASRCGLLSWIIASCIVLIAVGASYVQTVPGPGQSFVGGWSEAMHVSEKLMATIGTIARGWLPLPLPTRHFWNTHLLDNSLTAQCALGLMMLTVAAFVLRRHPPAFILLLLGVAGLLVFTYTQFRGATRHHGHLYMILIAAAWLGASVPGKKRSANLWLIGLLGLHAISGLGANVAGAFLPFSASAQAAAFLRAEAKDTPIVGHTDICVSPVSGYLGQPICYPQMYGFATFNTQDDRARLSVDTDTAFAYAAELSEKNRHAVLLVLSSGQSLGETDRIMLAQTGGNKPPSPFEVQFLRRFDDATVADETYSIYRIRPASVSPPP